MLGRLYPYYTRDILAGRTERTEVSGTGIEVLPECSVEFDAVPNLTEDFGRVCTEQIPQVYNLALSLPPNRGSSFDAVK